MARARKHKEDEETKPQIPPSSIFLSPPDTNIDDTDLEEDVFEDEEFDIFVDIGDRYTKAGDRISYTIKRDGEFIAGSIKHPFSWDRVQKEYGGGTYQVIARSTNRGKYVKAQSRNVAALTTNDNADDFHEEETRRGNSTTELLALMQEQKREEREALYRMEEKRERDRLEREERLERERTAREEKQEMDRKQREEEMKNSGNQTMLMMMKMMESNAQQQTALLTAVLGGRKEPEVNLEKIMNMMDQRMEKVVAMVQGKDKTKDIDALKLIELQSQAEDRGYKRAMDLHAQAERKAEELAEKREEFDHGGEKEPSTTKMLLDAVGPAIQTLMAVRGGIPAAAPQALPPATMAPRQLVAQPPRVRVNPQPKVAQANVQSNPQPKVVQKPVVKEASTMSQKDLIENTVFSEIGKDLSPSNIMLQKFNPEATADKTLAILKPFGISPSTLCSAYTVDDMLNIAKAKGVPDAIKPYIERFHAHIKGQATVVAGSSTESSELTDR